MEILDPILSPFSNLSIRAYFPEDDFSVAHVLLNPRTWTGGLAPNTATRIPTSFDDALDVTRARHDGAIMYTIVDHTSGTFKGVTGLTSYQPSKERVQVGRTLIHPDNWGRGLNHELKLVLLDWFFSAGIGRVEAEVDTANLNSMRSLSAFGFESEGIRRRAFRGQGDSWKDIAVFSIIVDEWPKKREMAVQRLLARRGGMVQPQPSLLGADAA